VAASRISRLAGELAAANLGALIVTHPPNIRYLTGLNASAGAAILRDGQCTLIVDFRYRDAALAAAGAEASIRVRVAAEGIDAAVASDIAAGPVSRIGIEAAHLPVARYNRLAAALALDAPFPLDAVVPPPALVPTERLVERMRAIKDEGEIATLREAARRLSLVASRAREFARPGLRETEVAAAIDAALRDAGFERPAFDTIVASGPNSALPHARPTPRPLAEGDGVLLDFGGIYDGYCVDLTRTLHLGAWSEAFRRLFVAVSEARGAALGAVKAGALATDIDKAARQVFRAHGLLEAFGHGTGHGLGLEVHEEPRISPLAPADDRVSPGMVFTIEPGAYIAGVGGVRIEDDVLVTEDGCEMLTDVAVEL